MSCVFRDEKAIEAILSIFQNPQVCHAFKNEICIKLVPYQVKHFQLIRTNRFEFMHDTCPLALMVQVPFHPKINLVDRLPKEISFDCFSNTKLSGVLIRLIGEVVQ
jgi:hypothetical protein